MHDSSVKVHNSEIKAQNERQVNEAVLKESCLTLEQGSNGVVAGDMKPISLGKWNPNSK